MSFVLRHSSFQKGSRRAGFKNKKKTYEEPEHRTGELEREICEVKQAEKSLRRQNNYLTALHERSLRLIDHLDKEKLLEAILQRAAMLTGTEHGFIYINLTIFNLLTKWTVYYRQPFTK